MRIKTITTLLIASVLTVACEKYTRENEIPGLDNSYIFFEPSVNVSVDTKAVIADGETLPTSEFGVLGNYNDGTQIFSKYDNNVARVYKREGSELYSYDHLAQWKDGSSYHSFYAFYPYFLPSYTTLTTQNATIPYINYTQPTKLNEMVDILTATKTAKKDNTVNLEFKHHLWWLSIKINSSINSVKIKSVKLTLKNFHSSGTLKLDGTTTCNTQLSNGVFILHKEEDVPIEIASGESYDDFMPMLFLPIVESGKLQYKLEIVFANSDHIYTYPEQPTSGEESFASANIKFESGKKYTITVDKKFTGLNLNITREDWTSKEVNHEFN